MERDATVLSTVQPCLQIGIGYDVVIHSVAVFLLARRIEQLETGRYENGPADYVDAIAEHHIPAVAETVHIVHLGL